MGSNARIDSGAGLGKHHGNEVNAELLPWHWNIMMLKTFTAFFDCFAVDELTTVFAAQQDFVLEGFVGDSLTTA